MTPQGPPVECCLTPGASSDGRALRSCHVDVPAGRVIDAGQAYHDDEMEDFMAESAHMEWRPLRQEPSTRALPPYMAFVQHDYRNGSKRRVA